MRQNSIHSRLIFAYQLNVYCYFSLKRKKIHIHNLFIKRYAYQYVKVKLHENTLGDRFFYLSVPESR